MAMRAETIEIGIYALALGLFGLLGYEFYRKQVDPREGPADWKKLRKDLRERGDQKQPDDEAWRYGPSHEQWWERIQYANWTGKLPPKPVEEVDQTKPEEAPPPPVTPIGDVIQLHMLIANGDDVARIQIRYKDPNVQVPVPEGRITTSASGPMDTVGATGATTGSTMGAPFHHLLVGDTLFPPYQVIKFVGVELEGPSAVFERPDPDPNNKKPIRQTLQVMELSLSEEHVDGDTIEKMGAKRATTRSKGPKERPWSEPPGDETALIDNVFMISNRDNRAIQQDYNRILTEDIVIEDYQSRYKDRKTGKRLKGVHVSNVSRTAARFGVRKGDILIKVNGERVKSKSSAVNVGKKQYKRGIRMFELTFLSGGREVVRTYRAPDK